MNEKDEILNNRAHLKQDKCTTDCTEFECCDEELVFAMQDSSHQFSIGLSLILQCLAIAEKEGYVPPIPKEWWWEIRTY